MNEENRENSFYVSTIVPVKRKRGRPRKHPRPDLDYGSAHILRDQNPNPRNDDPSPGVGEFNGNNLELVDPGRNVNDGMVGQAVHGVIEAAFDAGYLLTVRVGNSDTTLRGVVFKPGCYVPVSSENDVAPGVQMIRRNDVPIPGENHTQFQSHSHIHGDRNGIAQAARASNPIASKSKKYTLMAAHTGPPASSGDNTVPIILQNIDLSNGQPTASERASVAGEASHPVPSKGKEVVDAHPSNGAALTNQMPGMENEELHLESQRNHQVMPSGLLSQIHLSNHGPEVIHTAETRSMKGSGMAFEKLLNDVINNSSVDQKLTKDSGLKRQHDVIDTEQALSVEPLRAVQPNIHNHPGVMGRPLENYGAGRMTELLQVMQESLNENESNGS